MPPYRKRFYRNNFYQRRRRRFRYRRPRNTFRRRWRLKRNNRRHRKVKKRKYFKKKIKIAIQQFQPSRIRKCKIIGTRCLFQGSPLRTSNNYTDYANSVTPKNVPGGGGWSLQTFTLENLFDDFQRLKNIWTESNAGLPLVRYLGCTFKFYQSLETDYLVHYDRCWPMVDTPYTHADCSPTGMFLKKRKITIPSRQTQINKKPYKKVHIKPPTQMQTKWYFQHDLCKTPLLMLTATSVSLTNPYCYPKAKSNNITLYMLNSFIFQKPNFQNFPQTTGYSPKRAEDTHQQHFGDLYLWATHSTNPSEALEVTNTTNLSGQLYFLGNTKTFNQGTPLKKDTNNTLNNWGNPFYHTHADKDSTTIYISYMSCTDYKELLNNATTSKTYHLTRTEPIYFEYRYNPETDTGANNKVYLVSNSSAQSFQEPQNTNLIFEGFPLYILLWGWPDWIKKAKLTINPDENQILVLKTDQLHGTKQPYYIPINKTFIEGTNPYTPENTETIPAPTQYNHDHWYPKLEYQLETIEKICMSGPGCARMPFEHYMQAYCKYKFYFKFGGCPKELQKAYDPCLQPKWATPDNIPGRLEIKNPITNPATEIYSFDWESDYVTEECIQRIKQHTSINPKTVSISETNYQPPTKKKAQETTPTEEAKKKLLKQLQLLQQQRQQLQQLLSNRITT